MGKIHKKTIFLLAIVFVLAFQIVLSVIPQQSAKAVVAPADPKTVVKDVNQIAYEYVTWRALTKTGQDGCSDAWAKDINVDSGDAAGMKWFDRKDENTYLGQIAGGTSSGFVDCNNGNGWLAKGLDFFGYQNDYTKFLTEIGFVSDGTNFSNAPSKDELRARANTALTNKSATLSDLAANGISPLVRYYLLLDAFTQGCQAKSAGLWSAATGNDQNGRNAYKIYYVDEKTGALDFYLFKSDKSASTNVDIASGVYGDSNFSVSCKDLAIRLQDKTLGQAYSDYAKKRIAAGQPITEGAAAATAASQAGATNNNDGCYSGISVFGWILCPILDLADSIYTFLTDSVLSLLAMPELTKSSSGLEASWAAVKNIANATLILVALFMIASQVFNFSFVDAYTVKKVLPRLVIAVILIQLSWFLFTTMIQLFNALGYGLNALITAPFEAAGKIDIVDLMARPNQASAEVAGVFAGGGLAIGGTALVLTALSPGGWITLALTAIGVLISIIMVVLTLVIRKLLLITLLVIAPIALVAWILPGTQKFWSSWWSLFTKLLIMFPLIALLFATGKIFASVVANANPTAATAEGSLNTVIVIIAYFAPLFLVPATFKFAGGIFGSIVGGMNNLSGRVKKSGFGLGEQRDAIKKYNSEARAKAFADRAREQRGDLLNKNSRFARTRARAGMGLIGYSKTGSKILKEEKTAGANRIDAEKLKTASEALNNQFKDTTFDYPQQKELAKAVAAGATSYDYNGQSYKTGIDPSEYSTRAAAGWLAQNKDVDAVRQTLDNLYSKGDPASAQLAEQIKNENVGSLIGIAADLYAKGPADLGHAELAGQKSTTLRNFRAQLADWEKQAQNLRASGDPADTLKAEALEKKILTTQEQAEKALHASNSGTLSIPPENQVELERILNAQFEPQTQQGEKIVDYAGREQGDPNFGVKHKYDPSTGSSNSTTGNMY